MALSVLMILAHPGQSGCHRFGQYAGFAAQVAFYAVSLGGAGAGSRRVTDGPAPGLFTDMNLAALRRIWNGSRQATRRMARTAS